MKASKTELRLAYATLVKVEQIEDQMIANGVPHQRYSSSPNVTPEWLCEQAVKSVRRVKRGTSDTSPMDRAAYEAVKEA